MGDSSDAHSFRTRGGIPSEPYALPTSKEERTLWTLREEMIGGGMGEEGVGWGFIGGGGGASESSKVELRENILPRRLAFSAGELAIV